MTDEGDDDGPRRPKRLSSGPGGPAHRRQQRELDRAQRGKLISDAIARLQALDPEPFPDMKAILQQGEGLFSKNRVYDEADLMYAAQAKWNERRRAEGAPVRKLRGGNRAQLKDWVSRSELEAEQKKLADALEVNSELIRRNERLSGENARLSRDNERLQKAIHDDLWPD